MVKKRAALTIYLTCVVMLIIAAITSMSHDEQDKQQAEWKELRTIQDWSEAGMMFAAHPEQPLVLYRDSSKQHAVYVHNGGVQYKNISGEPLVLLTLPVEYAYVYRTGDTLLLSYSNADQSTDGRKGIWFSIRLQAGSDDKPYVTELVDAVFDPKEITAISGNDDLLLLSGRYLDGRCVEHLYDPASERLIGLQRSYRTYDEYKEGRQCGSGRTASEVTAFERYERHPVETGVITLLEDEYGTVTYYRDGSDREVQYVYRYDGQYAAAKQVIAMEGNRSQLLLQLEGDEEPYMTFGYSPTYSIVPELMEPGWRLLQEQYFYRVTNEQLEVLSFNKQDSGYNSEPIKKSYPLPAGAVEEREHGLIKLVGQEGERLNLSVYDLLHSSSSMRELWMEEARPPTIRDAEQQLLPEWERLQRQRVPAELLTSAEDRVMPPEWGPALNSEEQQCIIIGCVDSAILYTSKQIDDAWYVLSGSTMFVLDGEHFREVGDLPVTTGYKYGEGGVNIYSPKDFLKLGERWLVADTYADQIVMLDEDFRLIHQTALPVPSRLRVLEDGSIEAVSLAGVVRLDDDLSRIGEGGEVPTAKLASNELYEYPLPLSQHLIDADTGLHWMTVYDGDLVIYDPSTKTYRRHYIGDNSSSHAITRVIRLADEVIILLDERLERFTPEGQWKSSIRFPRSMEDGMYDYASNGENSYAVAPDEERIYLVQGSSVLMIDLEQY